MKRLAILLLIVATSGCAGRSDMRSIASQSSAILNTAQIQASAYAAAQTRYEAGVQANIASFSKMTAIGNDEMKSAQVTWVDSGMRSMYGDLSAKAVADYQKTVDDATAAPIAPATITIDTSKVRQAVAKLNELAKEQTLQSQLGFLTGFASAIGNAFKDAQAKAAGIANNATDAMKNVAPVQK